MFRLRDRRGGNRGQWQTCISKGHGALLHAITGTAGGFTEKPVAAKWGKVVRESQGKKVELSLTLAQPIEPGDTVIVPESFW